eukprot:5378640-Prymnesium_polylepis.1
MPIFVQPYEAIRRGSAFVVKASDGNVRPTAQSAAQTQVTGHSSIIVSRVARTVWVLQRVRKAWRRGPVRALRDLVNFALRS